VKFFGWQKGKCEAYVKEYSALRVGFPNPQSMVERYPTV
jgi:hypothetical protein